MNYGVWGNLQQNYLINYLIKLKEICSFPKVVSHFTPSTANDTMREFQINILLPTFIVIKNHPDK